MWACLCVIVVSLWVTIVHLWVNVGMSLGKCGTSVGQYRQCHWINVVCLWVSVGMSEPMGCACGSMWACPRGNVGIYLFSGSIWVNVVCVWVNVGMSLGQCRYVSGLM